MNQPTGRNTSASVRHRLLNLARATIPPLRKAELKRTVESHRLIAHDARADKLCRHAGGRWLAVPRRRERAFRAALRELGHILPPLGPATGDE